MQACPHCQATHDYHPDPSGPEGEIWLVCEHCGYMEDLVGRVKYEGEPAKRRPPFEASPSEELHESDDN